MDATENSFARKFWTIFQGRDDAYGGDEGRAIYEGVTVDLMQAHLDGSHEPIGIYPIRFIDPLVGATGEEAHIDLSMNLMRVRWGCADIDTGDWNEAYRLGDALRKMGLQPWVERSRSKGWHIWIFVPQSVAAYEMRRCLKVAYAAIGLPAKEANPKSELLRPNQLGNYVRLPYPYGWGHPRPHQCMMEGWGPENDGNAMSAAQWVYSEDVYSDPDVVRKWASKWYEPPKPKIVVDAATTEQVSQLVSSLPRGSARLWTDGPAPGPFGVVDTSQGLVGLAYGLALKGWRESDVYLIVKSADERWGKFHERNDPESYYSDIVERAFR